MLKRVGFVTMDMNFSPPDLPSELTAPHNYELSQLFYESNMHMHMHMHMHMYQISRASPYRG